MSRALGTVATCAAALLAFSVPPAGAAEKTVPDPQGDSPSAPLDLLGFTVRNNDQHLRIELTVEDATRDADLFVNVKPRFVDGVRIVSKFRPTGRSQTYLIDHSITDDGARKNIRLRCDNLEMTQGSTDAGPTIVFDMPSRCLTRGNYGALRFIVAVEADRDRSVKPERPDDDVATSGLGYIPRG